MGKILEKRMDSLLSSKTLRFDFTNVLYMISSIIKNMVIVKWKTKSYWFWYWNLYKKKEFSLFQSGFHGLFYPEMEDAGAFVWPFRGTLRQNEGISGAQNFHRRFWGALWLFRRLIFNYRNPFGCVNMK